MLQLNRMAIHAATAAFATVYNKVLNPSAVEPPPEPDAEQARLERIAEAILRVDTSYREAVKRVAEAILGETLPAVVQINPDNSQTLNFTLGACVRVPNREMTILVTYVDGDGDAYFVNEAGSVSFSGTSSPEYLSSSSDPGDYRPASRAETEALLDALQIA